MKQFATLYIVRHGQADSNVKGLINGQSDTPLTEEGKKEARILGETYKDINFDAIFSSDLSRAKDTAEIIKLKRNLIINTNKLLRERSMGRHEGKLRAVFREENKEALGRFEKLTDEERWKFKVTDDVESDEEAVSRFIIILREIALTYTGKNILIVSHGGVMRALLTHLGWAKQKELPAGSVKNTGYIVLESDGVEFNVKGVSGVEKTNI